MLLRRQAMHETIACLFRFALSLLTSTLRSRLSLLLSFRCHLACSLRCRRLLRVKLKKLGESTPSLVISAGPVRAVQRGKRVALTLRVADFRLTQLDMTAQDYGRRIGRHEKLTPTLTENRNSQVRRD